MIAIREQMITKLNKDLDELWARVDGWIGAKNEQLDNEQSKEPV